MDEKSKEVTLAMMAGVGDTLRPAGWSGSVTEEVYDQLIAAGAVVVDLGSADAADAGAGTLVVLLEAEREKLAEALLKIANLEDQIEQDRLGSKQALADALTEAGRQLEAAKTEAANKLATYQSDAEGKIAALETELAGLKADSKPGRKS